MTIHSEWNSAFKSTTVRNSYQRRYWKKALWLQQKTLVDYNWIISAQKSLKRSQYFSWQPGFTETNLQTLQNVLFWNPTNFPVAVYLCPHKIGMIPMWRVEMIMSCMSVSSPLSLRCPTHFAVSAWAAWRSGESRKALMNATPQSGCAVPLPELFLKIITESNCWFTQPGVVGAPHSRFH